MIFTPNTEGTFYDLPGETYHGAPGLSSHRIRLLMRSPAHLAASYLEPQKLKAHFVVGTAMHQLVFQPELAPCWVVRPEGMKFTTKEGKAWRDAQAMPVMDPEDWWDVQAAAAVVRAHPIASKAIAGRPEVSVFKRFDVGGGETMLKARMDLVGVGNWIADLKTTTDARPDAFMRDLNEYGYHIQAAFYLDVWNAANPDNRKDSFCFIAVEKSAPYGIAVYNLHLEAIESGRGEYMKALPIYGDCLSTNTWPCYRPVVYEIKLPKYHQKETPWVISPQN